MVSKLKNNVNMIINKDNFFVLYLFLIIFAPPFFPKINAVIIASFFSLLYMLLKFKKDLIDILRNKIIRTFLLFYLFFLLYLLYTLLINFYSIKEVVLVSYRFLLLCPIYFICVIFIAIFAKNNNYSIDDIIKAICKAGIMQLGITLMCLSFPTFKKTLTEFQYFITGNQLLIKDGAIQNRFNGFSESLLDSFGFGTGIIASLPLYLSYRKNNSKYFILSFLLLVVPFFNARSGLVIYFVLFLFSILSIFKLKKIDKMKYIKMYTITLVVFIISFFIFYLVKPDYVNSMIKDFKSIIDYFLYGTLNQPGLNTAANLFSQRFWIIPNKLNEIVFGTGHTVFGNNFYIQSDVGYINDIWLCGIFGMVILYGSFTYLFVKSMYVCKKSIYKYLIIGMFFSLIIFQIKGRAFMYSVGTAVMLIILICIVYIEKDKLIIE